MGGRDTAAMKRVLQGVREIGSYLLIALVVPGGSVIALALWVLRHRAR
jgi:hypothetical protein